MKVVLSLEAGGKKEFLKLDKSKDNAPNTAAITPRQLQIVKHGLQSALARGPILGYPVSSHSTHITPSIFQSCY